MTPFLKWVGGKGRLFDTLVELMPFELERKQLVEPFMGGGSVFFGLSPARAVLSDANHALIQTYEMVRDQVDKVIELLREYEKSHCEEFYYLARENFNKNREVRDQQTAIKQAARFIYLNRTCFNGVYRVNAQGVFNVPAGDYKNPTICDEDALREASKLLRTPILFAAGFERALQRKWLGADDFVYLDPPYVPASETSNFTSYTAEGFGAEDHKKLRAAALEASSSGAFVMQSNSDTPFVRELYRDFRIESVSVRRSISADSTSREQVGEVVILNYDENGRIYRHLQQRSENVHVE